MINAQTGLMFPSPIGVIFFLMDSFSRNHQKEGNVNVSVSYRSYILSYFNEIGVKADTIKGFRLLSELYSFL